MPPTISEAEFLAATAHAAKVLYRKFGTHVGSPEDFSQQVIVWSLEAIPAYDPNRRLESFLMTNAKNRALNYYRDHVSRRDPPCRSCHEGTPCADGEHCRPYAKWLARNKAKANVARPLGIEPILGMTTPSSVEPEAIGSELSLLIDQQLPLDLRPFYLMMLAGVPVSADRKRRVQRAVAEILGDPTLAP
ncbi:sigma-70 family RNA polymerase sigma factor [Urbifossiella limnaea]|uniref:sigma-70 family RNA polymerase sigma factor n=1 Tax=Urbifossiella limnaea TaxID=2528023 RepID=UPI00192E4ED5|nr:sigma-70 family RNA polymerase sigma factor [Urbifossiella limnaea]